MDPLKANRYLAAGLGIASTFHGSMSQELHELAQFGNGAPSFAAAILNADRDCEVLRECDEVKRQQRFARLLPAAEEGGKGDDIHELLAGLTEAEVQETMTELLSEQARTWPQ